MDNHSIWDNNPLEFHSMKFLIPGVCQLLVMAQMTGLLNSTIDKTEYTFTWHSKSMQSLCILLKSLRVKKTLRVPVQQITPPDINPGNQLIGYLRDCRLGTGIFNCKAPLVFHASKTRA